MAIFSGWKDFPFIVQNASLRPMGEGRAEGLHLSDVIRQMKIAEGEKVTGIAGEQEGLRAFEGFIWETALEFMAGGATMEEAMDLSFKRHMVVMRSDVCTQIALEKDGIHMTPDGFIKDRGEVESYKHTRKSFRGASTQSEFEDNFWAWQVQEKSYCYALGVDTARWIVLWSAGDYSKGPGSGPICVQATMTWTADELVANWKRVLTVADAIRGK
jgi:hypothetical protein